MRANHIAVLVTAVMLAASNAKAQTVVDHSIFDALLRRHVANGLVDYEGFAHDKSFESYLASLDRVDPSLLDQNERLAFWINVYNAFTIHLITSSGERESIRNINRTLGFLRLKGPWTTPFVKAAGRTLTLDEVQYGMIRRESSDPRIHFALSCAAISCAPLRSEAYMGARLEEQLQSQGTAFLVGSPKRNQFDVKNRTWHRNVLFRYYEKDFGETRKEWGQFLSAWIGDSTPVVVTTVRVNQRRGGGIPTIDSTGRDTVTAATLLNEGRFRVVDLPFDWSLNSQRPAVPHPPTSAATIPSKRTTPR